MWSPIDFCQSKPVQAQNLKERSESECHPVGNENNWMAGVTTGYLHQSPSQQRLDQSNTLEWGVHLFFSRVKDVTAEFPGVWITGQNIAKFTSKVCTSTNCSHFSFIARTVTWITRLCVS